MHQIVKSNFIFFPFSRFIAKSAVREFFREFLTPYAADPVDTRRLKTAALIRLVLIVPTIFLLTFITMVDVRGLGHHPQAQELVLFTWSFLTIIYIAGNFSLCLLAKARSFIINWLTYLVIFIELATNQLILYLTGSLISPQTLFIIVVIAIYRVFLDYRFAAFSTVVGCGLFALTAFLEISEIIPLSPVLPFMIEHPVYAEAFGAVNIVTGVLMGIVVSFFSINYGMNQNAKLQKQLKDQSFQDGLTGIANRRRFDEYLDAERKRAGRNKRPLALLMIDIDAFKPYNDKYGHGAGDECLKQVARVLLDNMKRSSDLAARYGGEEFAVILPETDASGAVALAELLREKIDALDIAHAHSPVKKRITASLGVAVMSPDKEMTSQALINMADKALYQSKTTGRNRGSVAAFE